MFPSLLFYGVEELLQEQELDEQLQELLLLEELSQAASATMQHAPQAPVAGVTPTS